MKQKNRYKNYQERLAAHESAKAIDSRGRAKNIAGCSLERVPKSRNYEENPQELLRQLRWKNINVNDTHQTISIDISASYTVEIPPKTVYVGLGKEIGNKTRGKLDFLKILGISIFGWNDIK